MTTKERNEFDLNLIEAIRGLGYAAELRTVEKRYGEAVFLAIAKTEDGLPKLDGALLSMESIMDHLGGVVPPTPFLGKFCEAAISFEAKSEIDVATLIAVMRSWASAKPSLGVKLVDPVVDAEYLDRVVSAPAPRGFGFRLVPCCFVGNSSTPVTKEAMADWRVEGLTEQAVVERALANGAKTKPAVVLSVGEVLSKLVPAGISLEELDGEGPDMYVVTNENRENGAACLFQDGVIDRLADEVGGDFFVLPSSAHEMIVVPANSGVDPAGLSELVDFVNRTSVRREDLLSFRLHLYDAGNGEFVQL